MTFPISICPMTEADLPLVYATWKKLAVDQDCFEARGNDIPPKKEQSQGLDARIDRLLDRSQCFVARMQGKEDTDWWAGYIVAQGPVLHMVFVKSQFRKMGIASQLVAEIVPFDEPRWYTQRSVAMKRLSAKWKMRYNPFLMEI